MLTIPTKLVRLIAMALAALSASQSASGFQPINTAPTAANLSRHRSGRLYGMLPREGGSGGGDSGGGQDESAEVEAARRKLEALIGGAGGADEADRRSAGGRAAAARTSSSLSPQAWEDQLDRPPLLTAIARERRQAEIALLQSLDGGDDSLSDLWSLWFSERGPNAAADLLKAEELSGRGPQHWDEAEARLRDLIDEHGVHWAEPVNRLATLLYQRGRLEDSRALCQTVLAVKPWHFGALSGIVLVCAAMGDAAGARLWADRRLPPVQPSGDNKRRTEWVRRAVGEAKRSLGRAEELVVESFGESDDKYFGIGSEVAEEAKGFNFEPDDLDDAWQ